MIQVCMSGRNPTMRHLLRTHRVSVNALHEMIARDDVVLLYEESNRQAADIYTKAFTNPDKWRYACELISVFTPEVQASIAGESQSISSVPPLLVPPQVAPPRFEEIEGCPEQGVTTPRGAVMTVHEAVDHSEPAPGDRWPRKANRPRDAPAREIHFRTQYIVPSLPWPPRALSAASRATHLAASEWHGMGWGFARVSQVKRLMWTFSSLMSVSCKLHTGLGACGITF
jgi:hypothetical protein